MSAGEALPPAVGSAWEERFGSPILDGLGSTEMLHIFLSNRPGDIRSRTSGTAVPGYELKLVNEDGELAAGGEMGELWVQGGSSALCYWNQREKSLSTFHGPWTRTGDKYIADADGYYHYCGRSDDMLIIRGVNVYPSQGEAHLVGIEGISPHYQLVVRREGSMDELTIEAEAAPETAEATYPGIAREIRRHIKTMVGVSCQVEIKKPGEVPRSQGKAVRVRDLRH